MPTFIRPVRTFKGISDTFQEHLARGSVNPGTDYILATGDDIVMPAAGKIVNAQWSNTVGFWIGIDFDNGWGADLLHNSKLLVTAGQRVAAGAHIAEGGGTGSVATGPHCHESLRPSHGFHLQNVGNVDPEKFLAPPNEAGDSDMYRTILTTKGATATANLYDLYTDYETLHGVTYSEAVAHRDSAAAPVDVTMLGSLDGTSADTKVKAQVAATRRLWKRLQDANNAALARIISANSGTVVAPPLPTVPPVEWLAAISKAVNDDLSRRTAS
jgi:murein DD-endopeptidase